MSYRDAFYLISLMNVTAQTISASYFHFPPVIYSRLLFFRLLFLFWGTLEFAAGCGQDLFPPLIFISSCYLFPPVIYFRLLFSRAARTCLDYLPSTTPPALLASLQMLQSLQSTTTTTTCLAG